MSSDPLAAQRALIDDHMAAEFAPNRSPDAVAATFVEGDDAYFDAVPFQHRFPPAQAYGILFAAMPDAKGTPTSAYDAAGLSLREVTLQGSQEGSYLGVDPTGNPLSYECGCVFEFAEVKGETVLVGERVYFDNYTLFQQMTRPGTAPSGDTLLKRAEGSVESAPEVPAEQVDAVLKQQREVVAQHINFENTHEWEALVATWPEGAEGFFDGVPLNTFVSGREGVAAVYAALSGALSDLQIVVVDGADVPGCSWREIRIQGTNDGPYPPFAQGSGRPIDVRALCVFPFAVADGAATFLGERVYFDNLTIFEQMGVKPA